MERNKSGKELRKSGVLDRRFARSDEGLRSHGLLPKDGHIVDATFVEVPLCLVIATPITLPHRPRNRSNLSSFHGQLWPLINKMISWCARRRANITLFFLLFSFPAIANALNFAASGNLTLFAYPGDTNSVPLQKWSYTFRRVSPAWAVALTNEFLREGGTPRVKELSSVGNSTYETRRWTRSDVENGRALAKEINPNSPLLTNTITVTNFGYVTLGNHPTNRIPVELASWIALVLAMPEKVDIESMPTEIPNPFSPLAWTTDIVPLHFNAINIRNQAGIGEIEFYKPGIRTIVRNTVESVEKLPPPYDKGYVGLNHTVLDFSLAGKLLYPKTFSQTHKVYESGKVKESVIIIGTVQSFLPIPAKTDLRPPLLVTTKIFDSRTTNGTYSYSSDNHGWLSEKDVNSPYVQDQILAEMAGLRRSDRGKNVAIAIAFIIVLFLPVILFKRKTHETRNQV